MFQDLSCDIPDLKLVRPKGLASRLFFQVYSGSNVVGFAQLSTRAGNHHRRLRNRRISPDEAVPGVSYCLKIIEVGQNYRNRGVGSALLDEVIAFCKDQRVSTIYGEAKGDSDELRRWYEARGFELDSVDNMQLSF